MNVPCLSIMQPWSWLVVNGFKTIENRDWQPPQSLLQQLPMRMLIHAGKKPDINCVNYHGKFLKPSGRIGQLFPRSYENEQVQEECHRLGGIVGIATLVAVVQASDNPWYTGKYGLVLQDAMQLPFMPYRGQPGFFQVDYGELVAHVGNRCFCCGRLESNDGLMCRCPSGRCAKCKRCETHCLCDEKIHQATGYTDSDIGDVRGFLKQMQLELGLRV